MKSQPPEEDVGGTEAAAIAAAVHTPVAPLAAAPRVRVFEAEEALGVGWAVVEWRWVVPKAIRNRYP